MTKKIEYREDCFETIREGIKGKKVLKAILMIALKLILKFIDKPFINGMKR